MKLPRRRAEGGFTVVELLVSIAILAVLLAIAVPALRGARRRAFELQMLVNQRESMRILSLYTQDHAGMFPFFSKGSPFEKDGFLWQGERVKIPYWLQPNYWGLFLASQGYEQAWVSAGPAATPSYFDRPDPDCLECGWRAVSWHTLTWVVFARPAFFAAGRPLILYEPPSPLVQPQRRDAIVHASRLGLLRWITPLRHRGQPESQVWQVVHFDDEHGEARPVSTFRPGVWDEPGDLPDWCVRATVDGVRGWDI